MRGQLDQVRSLENLTLFAATLVGIAALSFPFLLSAAGDSIASPTPRSIDASFLMAVLVGASLAVAAGEATLGIGAGSLSRSIALLGVLVAIDATLRLAPAFFGASPIFALIVLVGFVFGPRFGFAMGALTLLLSAAITAGVGPWLPFQMLCAGWTGLAAGLLPRPSPGRIEIVTIAAFGAIAGFAYGAVMNLYTWPFAAPGVTAETGIFWAPSLSLQASLEHYARFYVSTSLAHDATRAFANVALLLVAGAPVVRLLRRFQTRTSWSTSGPCVGRDVGTFG